MAGAVHRKDEHKMTETREEALKRMERELDEIISHQTAHIDDPPRYILTGELIPPEKRGDPGENEHGVE